MRKLLRRIIPGPTRSILLYGGAITSAYFNYRSGKEKKRRRRKRKKAKVKVLCWGSWSLVPWWELHASAAERCSWSVISGARTSVLNLICGNERKPTRRWQMINIHESIPYRSACIFFLQWFEWYSGHPLCLLTDWLEKLLANHHPSNYKLTNSETEIDNYFFILKILY